MKRVLGIETSCDETGVAIYDETEGLVSNIVYSQADLHSRYGGVVPELASRDHIRKVLPIVDAALSDANLRKGDITGLAYTRGPGLMGALLVGAAVARSLAYALRIPGLGVNHMEAHLLAPMLEGERPDFPFLALLVSGGHTMLVSVLGHGRYQLLGESVDDAAGEAFDKTAKLLGLPYPGGPELAKLAERGTSGRFVFPRPMTGRPGLDMSFSGLKTFALNTAKKQLRDEQAAADIALAFEVAIVETLAIKCNRAMDQTGFKTLIVAGGVGANLRLRERLRTVAAERGAQVFYPRPSYCTDNGAMVALAGYYRLKAGECDGLGFGTNARWPLGTMLPPTVRD